MLLKTNIMSACKLKSAGRSQSAQASQQRAPMATKGKTG